MIALEQVPQRLETLGLKQALEIPDNTLDSAATKQLTYPEMLEQLFSAEVEARREPYLSTRTKLAHFPCQRTIEQFDFSFQPSIDERLVKELAGLAFVAAATNMGRETSNPAAARVIPKSSTTRGKSGATPNMFSPRIR